MKKYSTLLLIFLGLFVSIWAQAQSADLRFVQVASSGVQGGFFEIKVQIASSSVYNQGDFNIRFNFNNLGLSNPELSAAHNFNTAPYDPITLTFIGNRVNLNGNFNSGTAKSVPAAPTWTDVANVRFTITDATKTSQLIFRSSSASSPTILFTDNATLLSTRNLSELDAPLNSSGDPVTLPVTLIAFTANLQKNNQVLLKWTTASEINNKEFEVERSAEGKNFSTLTTVKGAGSSLITNNYQAIDANPISGVSYYRLKQIDFDGKTEYSPIVAVRNQSGATLAINSIGPNPVLSQASIKFQAQPNSLADLTITDINGKVMWQKQITVQQEQNEYKLTNLGNLTSGIYFVRILNGANTDTFKIVKE